MTGASAAAAPQRFGRYVLVERLGEGGMAEIFRAVIPGADGFRRQVVVKRIHASKAAAPGFIEMFVEEARISSLLHHPNIVQVFDFGHVDGSYFLAMELLAGHDLRAIIRALRRAGIKCPIPIAAHVAHQVAQGLSYAHGLTAQGRPLDIVHHDISPSNIMCLRAGGVKLLDFGVARAFGGVQPPDDQRRSFRGKLSYSAPEYVSAEEQDARIDVFALGIVLWELIVGERLFHGRSDDDVREALLRGQIPPPSSRRPAVPSALDRIVMKALERDPDRRYQSAAKMAEDLEEIVHERKYQSHMVPRLLDGLFGAAPALDGLPAAVEDLIRGTPAPALVPEPRRRARRWSGPLIRMAGAAALVVFGSAGLISLQSGRATAVATAIPSAPSAARRPFAPQPEVFPFASPAPPPPAGPRAARPPPAKPIKLAAPAPVKKGVRPAPTPAPAPTKGAAPSKARRVPRRAPQERGNTAIATGNPGRRTADPFAAIEARASRK